jgi:hypothetical protein
MHQLQTRREAAEQRTHTVSLLAVALFLGGLLVAAPAGAQPPPFPLPTPVPIDLEGYCEGFTAQITFTEVNQSIIQETTASDGTTTQRIAGHALTTVTNLSTGKSVTYNTSGPATVVIYPESSEFLVNVDAAGPNLLWTEPQFSYPGVPAISYTTGHVTFTVADDFRTTSYHLAGGSRQTDVCEVLVN